MARFAQRAPDRARSPDRSQADLDRPKEELAMGDLVFIGLTAGFFLLTWALIRLCESL
jgi:hypothetical protein